MNLRYSHTASKWQVGFNIYKIGGWDFEVARSFAKLEDAAAFCCFLNGGAHMFSWVQSRKLDQEELGS